MSNVSMIEPTFFDLYSSGVISAQRIADFVSAWHRSNQCEQRSLAAYLGLTDEEYEVWLMDTETLPQILAARRTGRKLRDVIAEYVDTMQRAAHAEDGSAIHALSHWLGAQREG